MTESNHSAEFLRGGLYATQHLPCTADYYRALLAAAEAREADPEGIPGTHAALEALTVRKGPSAEEAIAAAKVALEYLEVAPFEHCFQHERVNCRQCSSNAANNALAKIAAWEAARR